MKALVLSQPDSWPVLQEFHLEKEENKEYVKLLNSALNRRDVWITKGLYPGIKYPVILGSDGVGIYDGKRVVLNPSHNWGNDQNVQGASYLIMGLPENGSFAESIYVDKKYIYEVPEHLSDEEAAALPLAGLTAFRALIGKAVPKKGEKVLISGVGGGVALFALQFALSCGLEVFVSSGSEAKIEKAIALGVIGGVNYREEHWDKRLFEMAPEGFDVIIDGAAGPGFSKFIKLCRPAGRIVVYGGTQGRTGPLNMQQVFWKQISIMGSTMGSDSDFADMLAFVGKHKIVPIIDKVYSFSECDEAFSRMDRSEQFGKIVFKNR